MKYTQEIRKSIAENRQNWGLDAWIKFASLEFGVKVVPLAGLWGEYNKEGKFESNGETVPYGAKYGLYRDDTRTPLSDKAVSNNDGWKVSYYDTFKSPFAQMTEAGYHPFYARGAYNGSQAKIFFTHPSHEGLTERGKHIYHIATVESCFDSSSKTHVTTFQVFEACENGLHRKEFTSAISGIKRTNTFESKLIGLPAQANQEFESFEMWYRGLMLAESIKVNFETQKKLAEVMYPVTSLNEDKTPNKRAETNRTKYLTHVAHSAQLGNRDVTVADLFHGATSLNTHEQGRLKDEDSTFDRVIKGSDEVSLTDQFMQAMINGATIDRALELVTVR